MFTDNFDDFAISGESITCVLAGVTYTATIEHDGDSGIDDDDCHNPDQSVTGCDNEQHARLLECREAWFNDQWWFGYVTLSAETADGWSKDNLGSLSGIEVNYPDGNNNYLKEVANELLREYLAEGAASAEVQLVNHCKDIMMNAAILGSGT